MKKEILKKLRKIDDLLFSDWASALGLLTNLGLVTVSYILLLIIITDISFFEGISNIWKVNIFTIIYLLLSGVTFKTLIGKNKKFNTGFVISTILVIFVLVKIYIIILL